MIEIVKVQWVPPLIKYSGTFHSPYVGHFVQDVPSKLKIHELKPFVAVDHENVFVIHEGLCGIFH